jgi:cytochrome c oxidase subunit 1
MAGQMLAIPCEATESDAEATLLERLHAWVITVDHKRLGILYIVYSLTFLLVGGAKAICIHIQLMQPALYFLDGAEFNRFFTMHGPSHGRPWSGVPVPGHR